MNKEAVILVAGRAGQALLTIAGFRLLTTFLPPAEVGNYYLIMSVASLFGMFLLSPVGLYLNRRFFLWHDSGRIFEHFLGYNAYALLVSAAAFCFIWAAWKVFGIGAGLPGLMFAWVAACYIYVLNWNQNFIPALNTLGYRVAFVLLTMATTGLGLLFSVAFVRYLAPGAVAWMAGLVVSLGIMTILSSYLFRRKVREARPPFLGFSRYLKKETIRVVAAFSLPLAGATLFMWAQAQSYRVLVEKVNGAEMLGFLSVGFSIATSVAGILESLVQQLYLPGYYRRISGGDKAARQAALAELAAKTIPVYLIYLFFIVGSSEYLVNFLVAERYHEVFVYARYGAFIEFFRMSANILASAAHSEMRTTVLIKPYFSGGLASVAAVAFAAYSPRPEVFIPLALVFSGAVTLLAMRAAVEPIIGLKLRPGAFVKPLLFSLPFLPLVLVRTGGFYKSLGLLAVSGAYFAFLQYRFSRRWLASENLPASMAKGPPGDENLSPAEADL